MADIFFFFCLGALLAGAGVVALLAARYWHVLDNIELVAVTRREALETIEDTDKPPATWKVTVPGYCAEHRMEYSGEGCPVCGMVNTKGES